MCILNDVIVRATIRAKSAKVICRYMRIHYRMKIAEKVVRRRMLLLVMPI